MFSEIRVSFPHAFYIWIGPIESDYKIKFLKLVNIETKAAIYICFCDTPVF